LKMMFTETDARYFLVRTSQKVTDALEAASVTCPSASARDATRKLFTLVAVGHATCILEFGDECDAADVRKGIIGVGAGVGS
jgi:hypothetical protein